MLSRKLGSAVALLRRVRGTGLPMTGPEVAALEAHLEGCLDDAKWLENQPLAQTRPGGDLPAGVTDLSRVRAEREIQAWLRDTVRGPKGPGGAA